MKVTINDTLSGKAFFLFMLLVITNAYSCIDDLNAAAKFGTDAIKYEINRLSSIENSSGKLFERDGVLIAAMQWVIDHEHIEIAAYLLSLDADCGIAGARYKAPAVHRAATLENAQILTLMLQKQPHLISAKDCDGNLPVHYAVASSRLENVKLLSDHKSVNEFNSDGCIPLDLAMQKGDQSIIQFLIEQARR